MEEFVTIPRALGLIRLLLLAAFSNFALLAQNATPKFVYIASTFVTTSPAECNGGNLTPYSYIVGFTTDAVTGALTPIPGSPFNSPGFAPEHLAADPLGRFLWVANAWTTCDPSVTGTIGTLRIDPVTGALTPVGTLAPVGNLPLWVTTDPLGRFVFVVNHCISSTDCSQGTVSVFSVNQSDGTLTPVPGSPFLSGVINPVSIAINPGGTLALLGGNPSANVFSISPSGALSLSAGPFPGPGLSMSDILVDPSGHWAIVLYEGTGPTVSAIGDWSIGPGGALLSLGSQSAVYQAFLDTMDPFGRFIYTGGCPVYSSSPLYCMPGLLAGWTLNASSGALTPISGTQVSSQGGFPTALGTDASGRFLFVINQTDNAPNSCNPSQGNIATFNIDQTSGALTPISGMPVPDLSASSQSLAAVGQTHVAAATLTGVRVTADSSTIAAGQTAQFTVSGSLSDGTTAYLTSSSVWQSSNTSVAVISSTGVAFALSQGSTTVTACYGSFCGSAALTVTSGAAPPATLSPASLSFPTAGTQSLVLSNNSSSTLGALTIRFSGPSAADFTETDNCGGALATSASCTINITLTPGAAGTRSAELDIFDACLRLTAISTLSGGAMLSSIAITPLSATITAGKTQQYAATGTYSDGYTQNITNSVTWTSSDATIAAINAAGLATGLKAGGPVSIQAKLGSVSSNNASLTVTAAALVSIAITPVSSSVAVGSTVPFTATGTYTDGSTQNITGSVAWSSSDTTIATISTSGVGTGVNAGGPVNIQASLSGIPSNKALLTVTARVPVSIAITPISAAVLVGRTQGYTATATYSNGSTANITTSVTWASSNGAVAAIGSIGFAFGMTVGGPVNITASVGGTISNTASLTVTPPPSGAVLAWGLNASGELGNGNNINSNVPVAVNGLTGVIAVAGGGNHSVAVKSDGTVWAWGDNSLGQLGNTTTSISNVPVQVSGLTGVVAISAGFAHNLALKSDGTVWTWGVNNHGQLGNGNTLNVNVPVQVLTGVVGISTGSDHSLALKSDGTVWTWGYGAWGQIGNGGTADSNVPVQVNLSGVVAVGGGEFHSLALKLDGTVWAWGQGEFGQLGQGAFANTTAPVQVTGLPAVVAIAAGSIESLALKPDGTVWAWGGNGFGELGNGNTTNTNVPAPVAQLSSVVALAGGSELSLALRTDGTLRAWGFNNFGAVGNGNNTSSAVPVPVLNAAAVVAIGAGPFSYHDLAITTARILVAISVTPINALVAPGGTQQFTATGTWSDGTTQNITSLVTWTSSDATIAAINTAGLAKGVKAGTVTIMAALGGASASAVLKVTMSGTVLGWGFNAYGQLGNGTSGNNSSVPVPASGISGVVAVSGGSLHSLALKSDGTVWSWGGNFSGELGNGSTTNSNLPAQVPGVAGVTDVKAGASLSLALQSDGTVRAWGDNISGQLGNGTNTNSHVPVPVSGLTGVVAIASGSVHSLAVKSDGSVWAWGYNVNGQLGNGTTTSSNKPVQVSGLTGAVAVAAGKTYSLALTSDGTVWAWGDNTGGELGTGNLTSSLVPVQVSVVKGVAGIAAGAYDAEALESDGSVWRWGVNSSTPSRVFSKAVAIAEGLASNYVLKPDGTVWASGLDDVGQLGNAGQTLSSPSFVQVVNLAGATAIASGPETEHALAIAPVPVSITIAPASATIAAEKTQVFTATATYSGGSTQEVTNIVTWSSSDSTVAAIGQSGLALGLKAGGPMNIQASLGGVSSNAASLTVTAAPSGTVWAWGFNARGQLGNGTNTSSNVPVEVNNLTGAVAVATGSLHSLAAKSDGTVWAWGFNSDGELGIGNNTPSTVPVQVGLSSVLTVAAGFSHSLALKSDGTVWAWGHNADGELGNASNTASNVPVHVAGLTGVVAIAGGAGYSLALKADGTVWAWGTNSDGELGTGSATNSNVPVQVSGLTGVIGIVGGATHSLALKSDGSLWAWGSNFLGQLGNSTTTGTNVPVPVIGIGSVVGLGAGQFHSLALRADGTVWAWGDNFFGQLGNGSNTPLGTVNNVPGQVANLTGVGAIASLVATGLALKSDGTVWAWGSNSSGELGNGGNANSDVPVQVSGLSSVIAIGQGFSASHALAISSGTMFHLTTAVSPIGAGAISPATGSYAAGSNVNVVATANTGYVFTGFSGALTGAANPQTLTLNSDSAVTANFAPLQPALTASVGVRTDGSAAGTPERRPRQMRRLGRLQL
jgi:alpha-tubulin suppressor-like RCC1 family protein/6-phosphogluconolactonase (cycloisomerase 2 family)